MARVLLLLPDELLEALDETRRPGEPRLALIRDAITEKVRVRNRRTINPVRVRTADGGSRFVPQSAPARKPQTMTRQGTLPDGSVCAHPFRDDGKCRICGHPW